MYSAFFRTFLNSPEKKIPSVSSTGFRYEWVTKVYHDGTWSLVWERAISNVRTPEFDLLVLGFSLMPTKSPSAAPPVVFTGDKDTEISAFNILLRVIYSWPVIFETAAQLCHATKLADYYCALPMLSVALNAAFCESAHFRCEILEYPVELLNASVKLRNKVLYKECMILLMGPWHSPRYKNIQDNKLKQLAVNAHHCICCKILDAQKILVEGTAVAPYLEVYRNVEAQVLAKNMWENQGAGLRVPQLYRDVLNSLVATRSHYEISIIGPLLKNELVLYPSMSMPGEGWCKDYFLCLELTDEDLPWDINEREW